MTRNILHSLALILAVTVLALPVRGEDVASIVSGFEKQKIEALEAYLAANPGAMDHDAGLAAMADAALASGDNDAVIAFLLRRYDLMEKSAGVDIQVLMGSIVQPVLGAYVRNKDIESADRFIETVRTDLAAHPMVAQINQFLLQLSGVVRRPTVGSTLEMSFTSVAGEQIDLADLKGKVVLIDFWATWCGPCMEEMPGLMSAYEQYHERGFEIIGVSFDADINTLKNFTERYKITWPQNFLGQPAVNAVMQKYGLPGLPSTFLIDKDGTIVATQIRSFQLPGVLEQLLGKSPDKAAPDAGTKDAG